VWGGEGRGEEGRKEGKEIYLISFYSTTLMGKITENLLEGFQ
jgi:hypothetical protein